MISDLTSFPIIEEGQVRVAPLCGLPPVTATFGVSTRRLLQHAGLPEELLGCAENTVSITDLGRLLSLAVLHTGCEHIALSLGASVGLDALGPIGALARRARDVGSALRGLIIALHLHDRVTVPALDVSDGQATLSTVPLGELSEGAAEIADLTMAACFNIARGLGGPAWQAREVRLARRAPADARPFARFFGVNPQFDAERNTLVFDADWMGCPVYCGPGRPQGTTLDELASLHPLDPPALVRRACVHAIIEGNGSVTRVALLLGLPPRTLNRQLALFGTTAQAELLQVKLQVAKQLLDGTELTLIEIGHLLGYTEASAFTRAFRSAAGTAPSLWRARHAASTVA